MTAPLSTMGPTELLARINELEAENARLSDDYAGVLAERCEAQVRCDELAGEHATMLANLTSTQERCTSLLLELRDLRQLAPFLVALKRARVLHPEGSDYLDLVDEFEELQCETERHDSAVMAERPTAEWEIFAQRIREEATDVAIVAFRISNGEGK